MIFLFITPQETNIFFVYAFINKIKDKQLMKKLFQEIVLSYTSNNFYDTKRKFFFELYFIFWIFDLNSNRVIQMKINFELP